MRQDIQLKVDTDTDTDGDDDNIDPRPVKYQLNGYFESNVELLEKRADEYYNGIDLLGKYTVDKEKWYVFMFIRQFNTGYVNTTWSSVGGKIDDEFVAYVKENDELLFSYFNDLDSIYANNDKELLDIRHLAATATVYIYESGGIAIDGVKVSLMPEYHLNNLGGWAGDLHTLMNDIKEYIAREGLNEDSYNDFYSIFKMFLGNDAYSFSQKDIYADLDAYNIVNLIDSDDISEVIIEYYNDRFEKRFTSFTNNWSEKRISNLVDIYTNEKYLGLVRWPLLEWEFSKEESNAARDAFVDYLIEERNKE